MSIQRKKYSKIDSARFAHIIHHSESTLMQNIYARVHDIAATNDPVVIVGEIGTGKKQVARFIHNYGNKSTGPFHTFYCLDLNENEFKDAFWERLQVEEEHITLKYDVLEKASSGILFLDQFSELSPRFMLDIIKSYQLGCKQLFKYSVQATPRLVISVNLERYQYIKKTEAWDDILQMINPVVVMLPPLRERKEDIPVLVRQIISEIKNKGKEWAHLDISDETLTECQNYSWPGNIRQLKNAIVQGAILSHGKRIESAHLPFSIKWKFPYNLGKE